MYLRKLALSLVLASSLSAGAVGNAAEPEPEKPLQTGPEKTDDAYILQGWTANILGIGGEGKTQLIVNGEEGYTSTATIDGAATVKTHPATFELPDKDHRIVLKVVDARGAEWSETVDVPKGMKVTVEIKARYEHRGFEGTIKNDTLTCRVKAQRRHLKFEVYQNGNMVGAPILLEPGKSAHGVRLKPGTYDLKVFEKVRGDYRLLKSAVLEPKEAQWRHEEKCQ